MRLGLSASLFVMVALAALAFVQLNAPFSQWRWEDSFPPHFTTVDPLVYTWHARQVSEHEDLYTFSDSVRGLPHVIPTYPPLQAILTASVGKFTTVHIHHLEWIMVVLETIWLPLLVFLLARRLFSMDAALLTLPLTLFPPTMWLFKSYIGHWGDVISMFFAAAALMLTILLTEKQKFFTSALTGVLLAAMFIAHAFEAVLIAAFTCGWLTLTGMARKEKRRLILHAVITGAVFLALIAHFFPVVMNVPLGEVAKGQSPLLGAGKIPDYYPRVRLSWAMLLLAVPALVFLRQELAKARISSSRATYVVFLVFLAAAALTYHLGTGYRFYRLLYSWYFFYALVPALGAFVLLSTALSGRKRLIRPIVLIGVLAVSFFLLRGNDAQFKQMGSRPLADQTMWDAISWISEHTPKDATVFTLNEFIHGFPQYFTNRNTLDVDLSKDAQLGNIIALCNGTYPDVWAVRCNAGWSGAPTDKDGRIRFITARHGWNSFLWTEGPLCKDYLPEKREGFASQASYLPMDYFDYMMVQYRGTGKWLGQNYDRCMGFFINESLARGLQVVWNNDEFAVLVNADGQ